MGMDGLYRPAQHVGYTDNLGHLDASDRAAELAKKSSQINQHRTVDEVDKDPKERADGQRKQDQPKKDDVLEDELQDLLCSQFNITLQPDILYRFVYNEATERFELIDSSTGSVVLSLMPDAFIQVTENMRRNSGLITDQTA